MALLLAAGCTGLEGPTPVVETAMAAPEVHVALVRGQPRTELGGGGALELLDASGQPLARVAPGQVVEASAQGGLVQVRGATGVRAPVIQAVSPDSTVWVGGREFRGRVTVTATTAGLLVVNIVDIEDYLAGVINAEMGRRGPGEEAALETQAIVSRTFALRVVGRWRTQGFDLVSTIADQAYGGAATETAGGRAAVAATRGIVLTYGGQPVEAFFSSTCGGRTASGAETFVNGALPYLQSIADRSPEGKAWCEISPRYRWREEWSHAELRSTLENTLGVVGVSGARVGEIRDVAVAGRSASGRVAELRIVTGGATVPVAGQVIRQVLRPTGGTVLRSTAFDVEAAREGARLVRLVVEGRGNGHGVGLCQWGAVGRARAGYSAEQILDAYFPGTRLERRW